MQYIVEDKVPEIIEKAWTPILDLDGFAPIKDAHKRRCTAMILNNTYKESKAMYPQLSAGQTALNVRSGGAIMETATAVNNMSGGQIDIYDPVLVSLLRRSMPNLIAYDIVGVQPMTGPVGLIFALRSRYDNQQGAEAFYVGPTAANTNGLYDIDTGWSGRAFNETPNTLTSNADDWVAQAGYDPTRLSGGTEYTTSHAFPTAFGEALGANADMAIEQMAFSIEKISVTARERALQAKYTIELAQDLRAVHGLDCEAELANILAAELLAEINREVVRAVNISASIGAQHNVVTAGTFNLDLDSNGRWMDERFKGLMFQIDREANAIARATRRGKGNFIICGSDVACALNQVGKLDYTPAVNNNLLVDDTGNTFVGILNGQYKVFIDPYFNSYAGLEYITMGYRGPSPLDAGIFYSPYVPLQYLKAINQDSYNPGIAFKTRYGLVAHPFATAAADGVISFANKNYYYRRFNVKNLM
jgi:hypothetical protein